MPEALFKQDLFPKCLQASDQSAIKQTLNFELHSSSQLLSYSCDDHEQTGKVIDEEDCEEEMPKFSSIEESLGGTSTEGSFLKEQLLLINHQTKTANQRSPKGAPPDYSFHNVQHIESENEISATPSSSGPQFQDRVHSRGFSEQLLTSSNSGAYQSLIKKLNILLQKEKTLQDSAPLSAESTAARRALPCEQGSQLQFFLSYTEALEEENLELKQKVQALEPIRQELTRTRNQVYEKQIVIEHLHSKIKALEGEKKGLKSCRQESDEPSFRVLRPRNTVSGADFSGERNFQSSKVHLNKRASHIVESNIPKVKNPHRKAFPESGEKLSWNSTFQKRHTVGSQNCGDSANQKVNKEQLGGDLIKIFKSENELLMSKLNILYEDYLTLLRTYDEVLSQKESRHCVKCRVLQGQCSRSSLPRSVCPISNKEELQLRLFDPKQPQNIPCSEAWNSHGDQLERQMGIQNNRQKGNPKLLRPLSKTSLGNYGSKTNENQNSLSGDCTLFNFFKTGKNGNKRIDSQKFSLTNRDFSRRCPALSKTERDPFECNRTFSGCLTSRI